METKKTAGAQIKEIAEKVGVSPVSYTHLKMQTITLK